MNKQPNGFTLLEVLIAFSIFLVIASVFPQLIKVVTFDSKHQQGYETAIFIQQITLDIHQASEVSVTNNILTCKKQTEVVTYGFFQQRIRRRVNNTGQEIALQNVQQVEFKESKNGIDIEIKDIYNQIHTHRITHLFSMVVNDE